MFDSKLFKNKKVVISGGRSGIGFAIAKHFLNLGAQVFITSRKKDLLEKATKELNQFGQAFSFPCDIRIPEQIDLLCQEIKKIWGSPDILVNNAGGQFPSLAEKLSLNGWNAVINNNLNGTFYMTQKFGQEFFIPNNQGTIVNITANVHRGFPGMAHTSSARAAVENLTKTLAQEWARFGIRINAVAPGTILSSGLDTYSEDIQKSFEETKNENLMKRLGTCEDVSNAVIFLASPLSEYINGVILPVDGMEHLHGNRMRFVEVLSK